MTNIGTRARRNRRPAPRRRRPCDSTATHALSLNSLRASKLALMSSRTRLIARCGDVYLYATSSSRPVTIETRVADNQPGNTPRGASNHVPSALATLLSQTIELCQNVHHSMYPRPRSWSAT